MTIWAVSVITAAYVSLTIGNTLTPQALCAQVRRYNPILYTIIHVANINVGWSYVMYHVV